MHWLRHDAREWWWWNGAVWDSETVAVDVQVDDWPHAVGALEWLLRACGATHVESQGQSFGR